MSDASIKIRRLRGFDDPALTGDLWAGLHARSPSPAVFLTLEWQRAWWETFGRGELLLLLAEQGGQPVALAPLFSEAGMIYFVGSGGSDYLDFLGSADVPGVIPAFLEEARRSVPDFIGLVFYHVLDHSPHGPVLQTAASEIGLVLYEEGGLAAPFLDLRGQPDIAQAAPQKKSLLRHERLFTREAPLTIEHSHAAADILPHLDDFFAQHQLRWAETPSPSLFHGRSYHPA